MISCQESGLDLLAKAIEFAEFAAAAKILISHERQRTPVSTPPKAMMSLPIQKAPPINRVCVSPPLSPVFPVYNIPFGIESRRSSTHQIVPEVIRRGSLDMSRRSSIDQGQVVISSGPFVQASPSLTIHHPSGPILPQSPPSLEQLINWAFFSQANKPMTVEKIADEIQREHFQYPRFPVDKNILIADIRVHFARNQHQFTRLISDQSDVQFWVPTVFLRASSTIVYHPISHNGHWAPNGVVPTSLTTTHSTPVNMILQPNELLTPSRSQKRKLLPKTESKQKSPSPVNKLKRADSDVSSTSNKTKRARIQDISE